MSTSSIDTAQPGGLASLNSAGKATTNPKSQLKVDDFIQMMVTQLQQQDPTDPAKSSDLLAQMSQIGQLQSSQTLQTSLQSLVQQNNIGSASNMIGKAVEGNDPTTGEKITGTVKTVQVKDGAVLLQLADGTSLPLTSISSIGDGASASGQSDISNAIANSAGALAG